MSPTRPSPDPSSRPSLPQADWSMPMLGTDADVRSLAAVLAAIALAIFLAVTFDRGGDEGASAKSVVPRAGGPTLSESDPSYFLLNALLVPALEHDALPLRWADPRPVAMCAAGTEVSVDGHPLTPGALVPVTPFELTWDARACRPFGPAGPRFEGSLRMTVFREDWGWSAIVEPAGMRIALADRTIPVTRGWVTMPQWIDPLDPAGPDLSGD